MKKSEVAKLLALASAFDNRSVGEANVSAWESVLLEHMTLADGVTALKAHFARSTEYLKPANVNDGVKAIWQERVRNAPSFADLVPELPRELSRQWRDAYYREVRNGTPEAHLVADREVGANRAALPPADLDRMNKVLTGHFNMPMRMSQS